MRHRKAHRKLGRVSEHRTALLRNQATALLMHEHIETTVPKAKELRPFVEKLITRARSGTLHDRRQATRHVQQRAIADKLFTEVGPKFQKRAGGYTRILKLGHRKGDGAEMARIELVET
jgi:large subunit ribosomal protein L17